jgi:hydrophobic/amphiphilic exporter-1 (mainly G- bacteria), HAE1 family
MFLSDLSIRRPVLMTMVLLALLLFGALGFFALPLNLMPDAKVPFVTIQTVYPGAGPTQVETQITRRIEDEVGTISLIKNLTSYSLDSASIIILEFDLGKDPDVATQEVKDKVDLVVNELPSDAEAPVVEKIDLAAFPIMRLIMGGDLPPTELYRLADRVVKERLSRTAGVGTVNVVGGRRREIRVEFDNRVVYENAISLAQVGQILAAANLDLPGGNIQSQGQDLPVRLSGEFSTLEEIARIDIPTSGGLVELGHLAEIRDGGEDVRERTIFFDNVANRRDESSVLLSVIKAPDGNAVDISADIAAALPELRGALPDSVSLQVIADDSTLIQATVNDTLGNIAMGIGLTALLLLVFLHDIRSTLIVALAMPLSIIPTFMVMNAIGMTLNLMSLMGISTAVGVLVMNSVVVLENIFRHKEEGHGRKEAAASGTSEVVVAVVASTMTNVAVFLPMANMGGLAGLFLREFALAVSFATLFSMLISFTLTPMLASVLLPEHDRKKHPIGEKLESIIHGWERGYAYILEKVLHSRLRSGLLIAGTFGVFIVAMALFGRVPFEFQPAMDEGNIQIKVELPQGADLQETATLLRRVEERIAEFDTVETAVTTLGALSDLDRGTNLAVVDVRLIDKTLRDSQEIVAARMTESLSDLPGARIRVSALGDVGPGGEAPVTFYLQGLDRQQLNRYSRELQDAIRGVPGLVNLDVSSKAGRPELVLYPDRFRVNEAGLTVQDLAITMRAAVEGMVMTSFKEAGEEYDIRVSLADGDVASIEEIGNITVASAAGLFPLSHFATVRMEEGVDTLLRADKTTSIEFTADVAPGFVLSQVTSEIDEIAGGMDWPAGYRIDWGGSAAMLTETTREMLFVFVLAIALTYMLLAGILERFGQPILILSTVPLSLIGVVAAFLLTGKTMNIVSMLAIVMLVGLVVNNAILILDYANQLRRRGKTVREALLIAAPTKLKPILMANTATILGMLPMALGIGASGAEMRQPMGIVSIGGLIAATFLSLFVIPSLENLIESRKDGGAPSGGGPKPKTAGLVLVLLFAGTLLGAPAVSAQEVSGTTRLDLGRFLEAVEANSLDLSQARNARLVAETEEGLARSQTRPIVAAQGGYTRNFLDVEQEFPVAADGNTQIAPNVYPLIVEPVDVNSDNEVSFGLSVSQTIFDMRVFRGLEAGRQFTTLTGTSYDIVRQQIYTGAKKLFYQTLLLREVLAVRRASEEIAYENFLETQERLENGLASRLDLLRAEVNWKITIPVTTQAQKNLDVALSNLKNLAGIEAESELILEGSLEEYPPLPAGSSVGAVLSSRPDYQVLQNERTLREINVAAERSAFFPSVSASINYAWQGADDGWSFQSPTEVLTAGVTVDIPIFYGGSRFTGVRKAQLELEATDTTILQKIDDIRTELETVRLTLTEASQRIDSADQTLRTAREAYEVTQTAAENGLATQLELKDARVSLEGAELNYYSAIYDYLQAYFSWQLSVGEGAEKHNLGSAQN